MDVGGPGGGGGGAAAAATSPRLPPPFRAPAALPYAHFDVLYIAAATSAAAGAPHTPTTNPSSATTFVVTFRLGAHTLTEMTGRGELHPGAGVVAEGEGAQLTAARGSWLHAPSETTDRDPRLVRSPAPRRQRLCWAAMRRAACRSRSRVRSGSGRWGGRKGWGRIDGHGGRRRRRVQ